MVIVITNSFNLIDGIDGLAAGIGILTSLALGVWFFYIGQYSLAIISVAITGAYLGFFLFNVSKGKNKIFMGDTGALILGFSLAYLIVHFNELNLVEQKMNIAAAPAVSFGILIVPLFDTLRVFLLRVIRGKSPFNPDKQHVHHRLLNLFESHRKTMIIILIFNAVIIGLVFLLRNLSIIELIIIEVILAGALSYLPVALVNKKGKRPIFSFDTDWSIRPEVQRKDHYQQQTGKKYTEINT